MARMRNHLILALCVAGTASAGLNGTSADESAMLQTSVKEVQSETVEPCDFKTCMEDCITPYCYLACAQNPNMYGNCNKNNNEREPKSSCHFEANMNNAASCKSYSHCWWGKAGPEQGDQGDVTKEQGASCHMNQAYKKKKQECITDFLIGKDGLNVVKHERERVKCIAKVEQASLDRRCNFQKKGSGPYDFCNQLCQGGTAALPTIGTDCLKTCQDTRTHRTKTCYPLDIGLMDLVKHPHKVPCHSCEEGQLTHLDTKDPDGDAAYSHHVCTDVQQVFQTEVCCAHVHKIKGNGPSVQPTLTGDISKNCRQVLYDHFKMVDAVKDKLPNQFLDQFRSKCNYFKMELHEAGEGNQCGKTKSRDVKARIVAHQLCTRLDLDFDGFVQLPEIVTFLKDQNTAVLVNELIQNVGSDWEHNIQSFRGGGFVSADTNHDQKLSCEEMVVAAIQRQLTPNK